jgi:hypothetical protein
MKTGSVLLMRYVAGIQIRTAGQSELRAEASGPNKASSGRISRTAWTWIGRPHHRFKRMEQLVYRVDLERVDGSPHGRVEQIVISGLPSAGAV